MFVVVVQHNIFPFTVFLLPTKMYVLCEDGVIVHNAL